MANYRLSFESCRHWKVALKSLSKIFFFHLTTRNNCISFCNIIQFTKFIPTRLPLSFSPRCRLLVFVSLSLIFLLFFYFFFTFSSLSVFLYVCLSFSLSVSLPFFLSLHLSVSLLFPLYLSPHFSTPPLIIHTPLFFSLTIMMFETFIIYIHYLELR